MDTPNELSQWLSSLPETARFLKAQDSPLTVATAASGALTAVSSAFTAATAASSAAWSGHSVTGSSTSHAMSLDAAYRQSGSLADLQASPATGAAQLMTLAMQASGYDPSNPAAVGSATVFNRYVADVLRCPLFWTILNDTVSPSFSGSWPSIVGQMASYFEGIAASELSILEASMLRLGNAASSTPSTWDSLNLMAQSAINVEGSTIDAFIYQTSIQMITTVHKGGKHEPDTVSNQAYMGLHRVKLGFDTARWAAQAAVVQRETSSSLKSWADANS